MRGRWWGLYFFSVISITSERVSQFYGWTNENHERKRGKGRVVHRLVMSGEVFVHKELARLLWLACWRQKNNIAFRWRICWWCVYFVLTEVIRHAIGKCCSSSFRKIDGESFNTKEGITKSCRFRPKKVHRIQDFELINNVLCFCK